MVKNSIFSAVNDVKVYANGLETALDNDKLVDASNYVSSIRFSLDRISDYVDSRVAKAQTPEPGDPSVPLTEAGRALWAAERAEEKAEWLERTAEHRTEEGKRLKKQAREAKKEAKKARDSAKKAQEAEHKAQKHSMKAVKESEKAQDAAR
ncbi:hypothetical protein [Candidatus Nitrososphaera sp. FF02]|uniref:hypothetical protein n=1 Tax=Candidatus Nitrososphaera sp. FF02 TaxID=3398226 RepID=UPI0039EC366B